MNKIALLLCTLCVGLSTPLAASTDVTNSEAIQIVWNYLNAVALNPSAQNLENLMSDDIVKTHTTNDKVLVDCVRGKDQVLHLYNKNIYDISSNFEVKRFDVYTALGANKPYAFFIVEEDKILPDGTVHRVRIITQTRFTLAKDADGVIRITEIISDNTIAPLATK